MSRKFTLPHLLIASNNAGKAKELEELLAHLPLQLSLAAEFAITEPEETGTSFVANAELKARYYGQKANLPTIADDSGLSIAALDGAPGVYSARLAGPDKDFNLAMRLLQERVETAYLGVSSPNYQATFTCALSMWWPDDHVENFIGEVHGKITFPAIGDLGFGYDPIFIPGGYDITFAQMLPQTKNAISHRKIAFDQLIKSCFSYNSLIQTACLAYH
ncbi:MAG: hypothetical protein RIT35_1040 [Pseudomonadota bacterium]|jgi:XTP/dITP diphosphohydrolase